MRAPVGGLSMVSPALAMFLLPFPLDRHYVTQKVSAWSGTPIHPSAWKVDSRNSDNRFVHRPSPQSPKLDPRRSHAWLSLPTSCGAGSIYALVMLLCHGRDRDRSTAVSWNVSCIALHSSARDFDLEPRDLISMPAET